MYFTAKLLIADVKEPLVVPWCRDVGTASADRGACHQHVLQPLVLSSDHKDPRLQFPFPIKKGTAPEALALSKTPYGLASSDAIIHRKIFGHHVPTRYGPVVFL